MKYSKPIQINSWEQLSEKYASYVSYSHDGLAAKIIDKSDYEFIESIICPTLESMSGLKHTIAYAILFFSKPNSRRGLHIDYDSGQGNYSVKNAWALNIPILNCQDSEMEWYYGDYTSERHESKTTLPSYRLVWESEPKLAESVKILEPTLVYIDQPHDVINHSSEHRIMMSIRTYPNILTFNPNV